MMNYFADIFLGSGALAAAFYCMVLSRRLSKFTGLDQELGSAIAVMSGQVDEMTKVLREARESSQDSSIKLEEITGRAEAVAEKLEVLMAALHDIPDTVEPDVEQDTPESGIEEEGPGENETEDGVSVFVRNRDRKAG